MAINSEIALCSDPTTRVHGAGLRQSCFTEREGSVKLYVQAVSARASLTHSQVVYDLHHTHALISEP